jgi:hypothetical protein
MISKPKRSAKCKQSLIVPNASDTDTAAVCSSSTNRALASHLLILFAGTFVLNYTIGNAVVDALETGSSGLEQGTAYGVIFMVLTLIRPEVSWDSIIQLERLIGYARKPTENRDRIMSGLVGMGVRLAASFVSAYVLMLMFGSNQLVAQIVPTVGTGLEIVFYEFMYRFVFQLAWIQAHVCKCESKTEHEPSCQRVMHQAQAPYVLMSLVSLLFMMTYRTTGGSVDVMRAIGPAVVSGQYAGIGYVALGQMMAMLAVAALAGFPDD